MIHDIHEKKSGIVVNKVPEIVFSDNIHLKLDTHQLPTVNLVLRSYDVLQSGGEYLFAFEKSERPVAQSLREIAPKIAQLYPG